LESIRLPVPPSGSNATVVDPEIVLLDKKWDRALENARIICMLNIDPDHLRQEWRLGSVQVVQPRPIGHKADSIDKIQEVFNDVPRDLREGTSRAEKALDDPIRIPVIWLTEPPTSNHEGTIHRDKAVGTLSAVPAACIAPSEVRPDLDDGFGELADDNVVHLFQEHSTGLQLLWRNFLKLTPGGGKVGGKEGIELRIVAQRLLELTEGGKNLVDWLGGRPVYTYVSDLNRVSLGFAAPRP